MLTKNMATNQEAIAVGKILNNPNIKLVQFNNYRETESFLGIQEVKMV